MKNIPVFSTEYGVATLILKEISSSETAYVIIQDTQTPEEFIQECISFCRAAGAERVYATGHEYLRKYPFHTSVLELMRPRAGLNKTNAYLISVTEETLECWRQIYNKAMAGVANASYMTTLDAKQMLCRADGYFIKKGEQLLGIGKASGNTVEAIVSVRPGAGQDVMLALNQALEGDIIALQVASVNTRALRLYEKLGFSQTSEISRWYKIF